MLPQIGVRLQLFDGYVPRANVTGIQALWWDANTVMDADLAVGRADNVSTDANGWITLNLTHCSLLNAGDTGALLLYRPNAVDTRDSELFAGGLTVESLGPGSDSANLIPYGMNFNLGYWAKTGIGSVQTGIAAPDGTLTACRLIEDASNGNHFVETPLHTVAAGTAVVGAVSIKPAGRTRVRFRVEYDASNYLQADIDLASASVVATSSLGGTLIGANATLAADGSVRVAIAGSLATAGSIHLPVYLADASGNISYQGDGVSGIDVWGAKLEAGAAATPFVNDSLIGVDMWYHPYDPTDHGWVRPADWLALPAVVEGEQKFVGLHAVFADSGNFAAVKCLGAYTVDWGDGTVENFASGVKAGHKYNYATFDPTGLTLCSRGYKQAIVTITPQAGQTLTELYLNQKHDQLAALSTAYTSGWLDIGMSAPLLTAISISGQYPVAIPRLLERYSYVGSNKIALWDFRLAFCVSLKAVPQLDTRFATNVAGLFSTCSSLRAAPPMDVSRCTAVGNLYASATALVHAPKLDTAMAAGAASMFSTTRALRHAPPIDLRNATSIAALFYFSSSAAAFPNMDTPACTVANNLFNGASNLRRSPRLNTSKVTTLASAYQDCLALQAAPWLDTGACTAMSSMFYACRKIESIPLYNTSNVTVFSNFANGCYRLKTFPAIDTSKATALNGLVQDCMTLEELPQLNTPLCTNFNYLVSGSGIMRLPQLNYSSALSVAYMLQSAPRLVSASVPAALATSMTNIAYGCGSLRELILDASALTAAIGANAFANNGSLEKLLVTGAKYAVSAVNCQLGAAALNALFASLGTAAGAQTITVTSNYGILEAGYDPSIATAKGWTVVA